ncbi:MAG: hypothetical protein R3178_01595, partial [Rhodothermales bacterium]|nr:hypothetical protein [Rhodothermales bacterium]
SEEDEVMISRFGDTESHNAGEDCMTCHRSGGRGEGAFVVAGTVYEEDGNTVNPGTTIRLLSNPDGAVLRIIEVDARGNFYTTEPLSFDGGLLTEVVSGSELRAMITPITEGSCNACHGNSTPVIRIPAVP